MIKLLHLRSTNFYGGPERQIVEQSRRLSAHGLQPTVAAFAENGCPPALVVQAQEAGLEGTVIGVKNAYDLSAVSRVKKYLAKHKIDILCTHDYRSHLIGHLVRMGSSARHVCFLRGFTKDNLKVRAYQWIDRLALWMADHIVAVSHDQARRIGLLGGGRRRVCVAHNAVDPTRWAAVPAVDLRQRFGLATDDFVVVSGGRFSQEKGQAFLIEAAEQVVRRNNSVKFVLFGDGPDWDRLDEDVRKGGLSDSVYLPGFDRDMIGCLKGADLVVNPSQMEGLPNIVLEAMAVGTPVVATAVGGVPELLDDQKSGLLVTWNDVSALTEAILKAAGDERLRTTLVAGAAERVASDFSFESQVRCLAELYRGLAK